jgi:formylmethanofuran dehydrogenase subunit B
LDDAVCTACGCVCDDITLKVAGSQIVEARRACALGKQWFFQSVAAGPACTIAGRPATLDEAVDRAARILCEARYPLVYGLSQTTSEAQRAAVAVADWIGAVLDTPTSTYHGPTGVAFHGVGEMTCTLGEVRNRGDVILFWGTDPAASHPRHFTKYSLTPQGQFVPGGRRDRHVVVVDVRRTKSADAADEFIRITPGRDFEALWTLRALVKGLDPDPEQTEAETGVPLETWRALMVRMKQARFGVFLYGPGLTMTDGKHLNIEALLALTRDMNAYARFVAKPMRRPGNVTGADNVVTWRTGYPFGVNLARGYPRFNPGEFTANEVLARHEADAALIVAGDPSTELSESARDRLTSIPTVAIDFRDTPTMRAAAVAIRTAPYGLAAPGTVYRMDDVPLPLRPAYASPLPSDLDVLAALERRILALKNQPASAASLQHEA